MELFEVSNVSKTYGNGETTVKALKKVAFSVSEGGQQRVAIGRVLIMCPSLILADKPTRNLDTQNNSEVIALLNVSDRIVTDLGRCSA